MFEYWKRNRQPTKPVGNIPIGYRSLPRPMQDSWNYPWGYQISYSQKQGENAWTGNQLPGMTNFIPGVPESYSGFFVQRNLQLAGNYVLSRGANGTVSTAGQKKSNDMAQQAGGAWQQIRARMPVYGFWQGGD